MGNHHRLIRDLVAEVRRLRRELQKVRDECDGLLEMWEAAEARRKRQAYWEANERESLRRELEEARSREWERQRLLSDLEQARRYNDPYAEERALRRLRNL